MVRYFNDREPKKSQVDGGGTEYVIGEIPKLKLKNKLFEVVKRLSPTTYSLKDPETGKLKERPAHVTQIARVRFMGAPIVDDEDEDVGAVAPTSRVPYHEQTEAQKWEQLKAHSFLVFNDPDDGADYLSVAEVLEVEHRGSDDETMVVWTMVHRHSLTTSYKHNMPLTQQRLSPEYVDGRGKSWEISRSLGFCTPRPEGEARGKSRGSRGAKPMAKGNLEGGGDGFSNPSRVLVEHGHSLIITREGPHWFSSLFNENQ